MEKRSDTRTFSKLAERKSIYLFKRFSLIRHGLIDVSKTPVDDSHWRTKKDDFSFELFDWMSGERIRGDLMPSSSSHITSASSSSSTPQTQQKEYRKIIYWDLFSDVFLIFSIRHTPLLLRIQNKSPLRTQDECNCRCSSHQIIRWKVCKSLSEGRRCRSETCHRSRQPRFIPRGHADTYWTSLWSRWLSEYSIREQGQTGECSFSSPSVSPFLRRSCLSRSIHDSQSTIFAMIPLLYVEVEVSGPIVAAPSVIPECTLTW